MGSSFTISGLCKIEIYATDFGKYTNIILLLKIRLGKLIRNIIIGNDHCVQSIDSGRFLTD